MSTAPSTPRRRGPAIVHFLLIFALWAAIYLPGLGAPELKGEEPRRILPAITMLETGNWLVPFISGEPYLRKPPLVNWLIACSFQATGVRNEWSARLPSALSILALALVILATGTGGGWMNAESASVAAALVLTPAAALDKGRLAEIEPLYLALGGIATVLWLTCWAQRRSAWLTWLAPSVALGLGMLAKGPLHLLFFYAIVLGVLGVSRQWRFLLHPAHFMSLAIIASIFAAWLVPYLANEATQEALQVWKAQSVGRVTGRFDAVGWLTNIPRALLDHLPWVLLAPLLWRKDLAALGEREAAMFRGARLGLTLCFFGFLLVPGALPRYTLPLLAPFVCLLALALADPRLSPPGRALRAWWRVNSGLGLLLAVAAFSILVVWGVAGRARAPEVSLPALVLACGLGGMLAFGAWRWRSLLTPPFRLALISAALIGVGMNLFAAVGLPLINRSDRIRPMAQEINQTIPAGVPLCVLGSEFQPVAFYLKARLLYAPTREMMAAPGTWLLTCEDHLKKFMPDHPEFRVVRGFPQARPCALVLLQRDGSN